MQDFEAKINYSVKGISTFIFLCLVKVFVHLFLGMIVVSKNTLAVLYDI